MKTVTGGIILAVVLLALGALGWREAARTERVAAAYRRLATLQAITPADIADLNDAGLALPWPLSTLRADVTRLQAISDYWHGQYGALPTGTEGGSVETNDAELMFLSANAQYRSVKPPVKGTDPKATVAQLDGVIRAYSQVLRTDGSLEDAAYNYEFAIRLRDVLAKGRTAGGKPMSEAKPAAPQEPPPAPSELPQGPTIHGHPGARPEEADMNNFKAISPMRYDEREANPEAAPGSRMPRKG